MTRSNLGWIIFLLTEAVLLGLWLSASWPWEASLLTERGLGEPMSLFEGISIWPTVALRAMSIIVGVWLVFHTLDRLKTDLDLQRDEMSLRKPCFRFWRGQRLLDRWHGMASLLLSQPAKDAEPYGHDAPKSSNSERTSEEQFLRLWDTYCYYGQSHWRLARAVTGTLMMMALGFLLANVFGEPNVHTRGPLAHTIYKSITIIDVIVTFIVIYLIVDATLFSRALVIRLTAVESHWPLIERNQEDWADIKFIARRTSCITQLIYFPFVMLALLIVSRSPIFDDYAFAPTLVVAQLIILTIIIASVATLRHAAEHARKTALKHLKEKIAANDTNPKTVGELKSLRAEIRAMQDGAFAAPLSQPIVKAVLLPLVSYGGTWLVQLYALPGL